MQQQYQTADARPPPPAYPMPQQRSSTVERNAPQGAFASCCEGCAVFGSFALLIMTFPFAIFFCISIVQEYQRAVIFRLGRLRSGEARGPGIFFILPCIDEIRIVDLRTVTCMVAPQEILTKDAVTVTVDAVVYHRVDNPMNAIIKISNYLKSTQLLAASTLRNVLGTKDLSELLSDRESVAHIMQDILDEATHVWGILVERVEIKDVSLPQQLQRAMAAEAEANRLARAKVIAAEGEKKSAQALKEASDVMSKSSAALQLRYLQTLNNIAAEHNSTIVFPIPMDMMRGIFNSGQK